MLRYISIVILLVVAVLFLSKCKEASDSLSPVEHIANALGVPPSDEFPPCYIRICNWSRLEPNRQAGDNVTLSKSQYIWTYFSDGSDFIDPKAVYFNNQKLTKLEVGQYAYYRYYIGNTSNPQTSCLTIAGLDGNSYNIIGNIDDEILFENLNCGDTLDLSQGITIEYSSSRGDGNDSVLVDMQYEYYSDADDYLGRHFREYLWLKANGGIVHIPASVLKDFPMSKKGAKLPYCTIDFGRNIVTTEYVKSSSGNNMLVAKVHETSVVTHVHLKRTK